MVVLVSLSSPNVPEVCFGATTVQKKKKKKNRAKTQTKPNQPNKKNPNPQTVAKQNACVIE